MSTSSSHSSLLPHGGSPSLEGSLLVSHVTACARARGRAFRLRSLAERLDDVLAPRFVTTVAAVCTLIALLVAST